MRELSRLNVQVYSEISAYVFSLDMINRGVFATNIEKLLVYSLNEQNKVGEDVQQIIVKIYDHFQLVLYQIENTNNIFSNSIDEAKENFQKQIKSVEKEYISILGIFAAIVLAFVGGITFSTSVLQNIADASIYRLLIIVDFLTAVIINIIYILVKLIIIINEKPQKFFNIKRVNLACTVIAIIIIFA